jgi:hypothetical protein
MTSNEMKKEEAVKEGLAATPKKRKAWCDTLSC